MGFWAATAAVLTAWICREKEVVLARTGLKTARGGDGGYTGRDGCGGVDDEGGDSGCAGDKVQEGSGEVFGGGAVVGRADGSSCGEDASKEDE